MKRKIFAALIAVVMVISMLPMSVMAADTTITVNTGNASDLVTAVEQAAKNGSTVTITAPIVVTNDSVTISATSPVTINAVVDDAFQVGENGTLTLGENVTVESSLAILYANNGGDIIIDGATLKAINPTVNLTLADGEGSTITIMSGTISSTGADRIVLKAKNSAVIDIEGGTITTDSSSAILADLNGVVNIKGGTVTTTCLVPAFCTVYARNGGVINVTGGTVDVETNAGLVAVTGGTVNVTGGTVNGNVVARENANAVVTVGGNAVVNGDVYAENGATVTISGGTVEASNEAELNAIIAATTGNVVITLTDDVTLTKAIKIENKAVTLNSNDAVKIIANNIEDAFQVGVGGNLALCDNITVESNIAILWAYAGGDIIIDGAILKATNPTTNLGLAQDEGSTITVMSGTISSTGTDRIILKAKKNAVVNIEGGLVTNANSTAVIATEKGIVNIKGGTVETTCPEPTYCAAYATGEGKIVVSGGTVKATAGKALVACKFNDTCGGIIEMSGGTAIGGVVAHEDAKSTATISGGAVIGNVYADDGATLTISGGYFSVDPTAYVVEGKTITYKEGVTCPYSVGDPKPVEEEKPEPKFDTPIFPNLRAILIDTTEGGKTGVASGKAFAALGSTYRVTLTPDEGYEVGEVLVNGKAVEVNKNNKVSFVVKANTYVEVEFVEIGD